MKNNNIKMQKDTNEYILYSPDSLNYITDKMYCILDKSIRFYKKLFGIDSFRKIQINYFDNINDFRNYIYKLRGESNSLPSYAKGTFDKGMINAFIEPDLLVDSSKYNKKLCMASHELFHIMYQELILNKRNIPRVVWFDEGMAQLFSGEYDKILSDHNFKDWFITLMDNTKEIPDLNNLSHGNNFETENYSGYKLSLLTVKYLYETSSLDAFKKLMHEPETLECTTLNDAIDYYNKKYSNDKSVML